MSAQRKTQNKKKLRREARAKAFADGTTLVQAAPEAPSGGLKPVRFCIMAKPIGPACNLRCSYCFYLEKEALFARDERAGGRGDAGPHGFGHGLLEAPGRIAIEEGPMGLFEVPGAVGHDADDAA